jgi:hypothetical protein
MNGESVAGIGSVDKRAPRDWPEIVFLHDAPNALGIDRNARPLQRTFDAAVAIAGKLRMNLFNLMTKLFIFVFDRLLMLFVGLVVIAAGGQPAYLAGFRN